MVTQGRNRSYYSVRKIACDVGGRGWEVWRLGTNLRYHVRTDEANLSNFCCDCVGFEARRECRHLSSLLALTRAGKLEEEKT